MLTLTTDADTTDERSTRPPHCNVAGLLACWHESCWHAGTKVAGMLARNDEWLQFQRKHIAGTCCWHAGTCCWHAGTCCWHAGKVAGMLAKLLACWHVLLACWQSCCWHAGKVDICSRSSVCWHAGKMLLACWQSCCWHAGKVAGMPSTVEWGGLVQQEARTPVPNQVCTHLLSASCKYFNPGTDVKPLACDWLKSGCDRS